MLVFRDKFSHSPGWSQTPDPLASIPKDWWVTCLWPQKAFFFKCERMSVHSRPSARGGQRTTLWSQFFLRWPCSLSRHLHLLSGLSCLELTEPNTAHHKAPFQVYPTDWRFPKVPKDVWRTCMVTVRISASGEVTANPPHINMVILITNNTFGDWDKCAGRGSHWRC